MTPKEADREAIAFADSLLVPTKWLKHKGAVTVDDLAVIFGVEGNVIRRRLRDEKINIYGDGKWPKL